MRSPGLLRPAHACSICHVPRRQVDARLLDFGPLASMEAKCTVKTRKWRRSHWCCRRSRWITQAASQRSLWEPGYAIGKRPQHESKTLLCLHFAGAQLVHSLDGAEYRDPSMDLQAGCCSCPDARQHALHMQQALPGWDTQRCMLAAAASTKPVTVSRQSSRRRLLLQQQAVPACQLLVLSHCFRRQLACRQLAASTDFFCHSTLQALSSCLLLSSVWIPSSVLTFQHQAAPMPALEVSALPCRYRRPRHWSWHQRATTPGYNAIE